MTDEERARILELLAREGQEQAPGILPEPHGPPPFPPEGERMVDFTEELEKALRQVYAEDSPEDLTEELWELLRQARKEAAALIGDEIPPPRPPDVTAARHWSPVVLVLPRCRRRDRRAGRPVS